MRALVTLRQDAAAVSSHQENEILMALSRIQFALEVWGDRNPYIGMPLFLSGAPGSNDLFSLRSTPQSRRRHDPRHIEYSN